MVPSTGQSRGMAGGYPVTMEDLLSSMVEHRASDLHVTSEIAPTLRIDGELHPMQLPPLTPEQSSALCHSLMSPEQRDRFARERELDFSFGIRSVSRYRANVFMERGVVAGAFRVIPFKVPGFAELGLPQVVQDLARKPRGLILVTGPTGSGKSTTLAAMVDTLNREEALHIITVEDPIEYVHTHKRSLVNQREVGTDTDSFGAALKYILREDPDVVLIGEMRDLETIQAALNVSETGHLVLATLHTNSAIQTINRVIDVFPSHQKDQVRTQLSFVLEGVVCQNLLPRCDGPGRVVAAEVLVPNQAVRNLIREEKIHQIQSMMQVGQGKSGMQTLNQSLFDLHQRGMVSLEVATSRSSDPLELQSMIAQGQRGGRTGTTGSQAPPPSTAQPREPAPEAPAQPGGISRFLPRGRG